MTAAESIGVRRTRKYRERQVVIVRAATDLINRMGLKGMTLADVAATLDLVPTAVNYYFATKEDLAARCFLEAVEVFEGLIEKACHGESRRDRVRLLVLGFVNLRRRIARGEHPPMTSFSDVRGLADPEVNSAYTRMFRNLRELLEPAELHPGERRDYSVLAHLLVSQLYWSVVWLQHYELEDYDRAAERMLDILEHGLGTAGGRWPPPPSWPAIRSAPADSTTREQFLRVATRLINERGYQGVSAERVSAALNLSKGAFYHHIDAKDDLVVACFRRTVDVIQTVQRRAGEQGGDGWTKLAHAATVLVEHQVIGDMPLLRTSALASAPATMKEEVIQQFERTSLRFASMICDGVADGSLRPVDSHIAAQMVSATINAAAELDLWAPGLAPQDAVALFVRPMLEGFATLRE